MCVAIRLVICASIMGLLTAGMTGKKATTLAEIAITVMPIKALSTIIQCPDNTTRLSPSESTSIAIISNTKDSETYNIQQRDDTFTNQPIADQLEFGVLTDTTSMIDPLPNENANEAKTSNNIGGDTTTIQAEAATNVKITTTTTTTMKTQPESIVCNHNNRSDQLETQALSSVAAAANIDISDQIKISKAPEQPIANIYSNIDGKALGLDQSTTFQKPSELPSGIRTQNLLPPTAGDAQIPLANDNKHVIETTEIPFSVIAEVTTLAVSTRGETSNQTIRKLNATNAIASQFRMENLLHQAIASQIVINNKGNVSKAAPQTISTQSIETHKMRSTVAILQASNKTGVSYIRYIDEAKEHNNEVSAHKIASVEKQMPTTPNNLKEMIAVNSKQFPIPTTIQSLNGVKTKSKALASYWMQSSTTTAWPTETIQQHRNDEISSAGDTNDSVTVRQINHVTPAATSEARSNATSPRDLVYANKSHKLFHPLQLKQSNAHDEKSVHSTTSIAYNRFNVNSTALQHKTLSNTETVRTPPHKLIHSTIRPAMKTLAKRHKLARKLPDKLDMRPIVPINELTKLDDVMALPLYTSGNGSVNGFLVAGMDGATIDRKMGAMQIIDADDSANKTTWPVKHASIVEGDVVLGGLMMVHSREDTITCGPIMGQGGIQSLEAMLYTLDHINKIRLLPNFTLGAHILDDCDKDTYGLEMAVDFIKGK